MVAVSLSKREEEMSTEHNLAYGLHTLHDKKAESKGDYEIPDYVQSPTAPAEEAVYEGLD